MEEHTEDYSELRPGEPQGLTDEGAFVSPEELEGLLSALDTQDSRFLESGESLQNSDDGDFLSPEDIESAPDSELGLEPPASAAPQRKQAVSRSSVSEIDDPALLSRIASELRSIKSELSQLKTSYDDAQSQSASAVPNQVPAQAPEAQTQIPQMPEALFQDMKKLLGYLDRLLESLPEEKIDQFARSEYFDLYRKVFEYYDLV
ncbi:MAG: hypothetical protein RBT72_03935 [Spirochaetia bacterium]|nr:hypothetical protein [Spirochaetales bacterium]MDX9783886.1 hypothetical protein [Spirochaetia bacterium]